jgi:hypothetical protein
VRGVRNVLTELGFVVVGLACYLLVAWYAADRTEQAIANAEDVLAVQQALGVDWERTIQDATLALPWLSAFFTHVYVWGYLPVMIGTTVWMYLRHPESYPLLRNALLASGAVGMVVYALYPCAPPRISHDEFTDTVTGSLDAVARPVWMNELAAIPSFHCGWLILLAFVVFRTTRSPVLRTLCVVHPALMCFAVVATGNHWVLDIPAGAALAAVGLLVATYLTRRRPSVSTAATPRAGGAPGSLRA